MHEREMKKLLGVALTLEAEASPREGEEGGGGGGAAAGRAAL